ncbi:membrane protein [Oceaniferula spumae]|uniref:Membrane protein n=1 Tax=Oceaniferula spumae TaxID=2979115 RepID=A0AAT9FHX7_9BACT
MKHPLRALFALTLLIPFFTTGIKADTTMRVSTTRLVPESKIQIIFDRAVIPDDQVNQVAENTILEITPPLEGKIHWKSANVADFVASSPPTMGVTYTFSLNKGLVDRDGKEVPAIKLKTIASEPFRVQGSSRRSKSTDYTRQPSYYVYFNDAVSAENAARYFVFKNKAGLMVAANVRRATWDDIKSRYYRGSTWQDRFKAAQSGKKIEHSEEPNTEIPNALMVTPANALPVGDGWYLFALQTLPNASNTTTAPQGRSIYIGNIEPFELKTVTPYVAANKPREIHVHFSSQMPDDLTQAQLAALIRTSPELKNAHYKQLGKTIIVSGDLRAQNKWKVTVNPTIPSSNGLVMDKAISKDIEFKTLHSGLALPAYDSAQYANGNRLYALETVNIASVRIRVKKLTPDDAIRTMQGYRHYTGNGHNNSDISPEHPLPYSMIYGQTVYDRTIFLDNKIDTSRDLSLDWNEILPKGERTTTFFVSVEGVAKEEARGGNRIAQSLVQLTDIGMCWKLNEEEAVIYAFSCLTGKPLANVQLQVFNEDAQAADTAVTNENGIARIPRNAAARHLRATLEKDCYIIPFDNTLDTLALWRFPVNIDWNHLKGWKRTATMFTDRNLYRPGETVQLKGVARRYLDNQIELNPGKTAQLVISDSASRVLVDQEITLSANGTFDYTLKLPAETVGNFTAKLVFPEDPAHAKEDSWITDQHRIFSHRFNVQEFRRNAYEVSSNITEPEIGAENITLNLEANYYQGQPVKNGTVAWYFDATQTGFYPEKFRNYYFGDHRRYDPWYWSHYFGYNDDSTHRGSSDKNGKSQLDDNGKGNISFDLPKLTFPTPLVVDLHSEITDSRDQTLTTKTKTTVHPADTYVGISRIDRLIRVGEAPALELIAVDTKGEPRKDALKITAVIEREYNEAVKIKSTDGKVSVKNTKKTEVVSEQEITIDPDKANTLPFIPEHAGKHLVTLKGTDKDGHTFSTASTLWIYGSKEYPWAVQDGMKIKLVPEKKRYLPGDTARLLVMTPIEGTALVTVERAGVHREYRRELKADNPVIELPLTDMDAPNAYVSVVVIRGAAASPRKHKEPVLKLGYCTLNVTNVKDRLKVGLEVVGSQHRPGEKTEVTGTVMMSDGSPAAGAEVVFYAEDEGTLAVAGYKTPNLMDFFHAPRPLLVQCGTSFSTFLAENPDDRNFGNKGFTIGGGDADPFSAGGIADDVKVRSDFNPCAAWVPTVTTDDDGKFKVTIANPDTLTRYRVMAIAMHGAKKFGHQTTDYTVNKPLMLEPGTPRYASEGDRLSPKVLVQNNSKFEGTWEISLETGSITQPTTGTLTSTGGNTMSKTISLKPGDASTVYFDVQFANTGTARWVWSAVPVKLEGGEQLTPVLAKDLSDKAESKFEVTYPVPTMRQVQFITMNSNHRSDLLKGMDPELLGGRGHLELEFSNSLLLEAAGAADFLLHYPYGCVEQTTSSLMPWFAVRDLKAVVPGFTGKAEGDISKAIQIGADRLLTMQTRDGGLAYWPGGKEATDWATAYGGMGLIFAKRNGANVPDSALEKLTAWMATTVKKDLDSRSRYRSWNEETRARTLYVLALAGKPEVALQNKMLDDRDKLTPTARCFLALAIHSSGDTDANKATALSLLENIQPREETKHWMRYHSDEAMQVLAWSEIEPTDQRVHTSMKAMLGNRNPYGHWRTTWGNSWALQAMASYARNVEKDRKPSTIQIVNNGETQTITLNKQTPTKSIRLPLQEGLKLIASSDNTAHTNIKLSAKPELAPTGPRGYSGMSIIRRYERLLPDGKTQPLGEPQVGDLVKISLDITFSTALEYVVIEDRLPSLFEAVNNDFASQSSKFKGNSDYQWSINHKELRSDRASFFVNRSWSGGTRTVSYLARVTTAGTATAPAAKVECMYDPIQLALSDSKKLTTLKKEAVVGK